MTRLSDAISAYQALLEGHRLDPDCEHIWQDLCKARREVEVEWLNHTLA